jgi:hypothetical protein
LAYAARSPWPNVVLVNSPGGVIYRDRFIKRWCDLPIYRLLENSAFEPEDIEALGRAYEEALGKLGLSDRSNRVCELVARKIIEMAQQGERDPQRLRDLAIMAITSEGWE